MKQYIITIILALCMASCSQHSKHWETLAQVESFIEERPDSALAVLQRIATEELSSKEEKAKHALLSSIALYNNFIEKTDFDVLQPAIDYYENSGTPTERMQTLFYHGRIYQNNGNDEKAMTYFLNALSIGKESDDNLTKARIYIAQGKIYFSLSEWDKYCDVNLKASELFKNIGLQDRYFSCLVRALNGFTLNGEKTEAEKCIQKCKQELAKVSLSRVGDFYETYLTYLVHEELNSEIFNVIKEYRSIIPEDNWNYSSLANAYVQLQEYEKALQTISKETDLNNVFAKTKYYAILSIIYENLEDYQKALEYYKKLDSVTYDRIYTAFQQDTQFCEERHALEMQKAKETDTKNKLIIIVLVCIIALMASLYILNIIRKRFKETKKKNIQLENEKDLYEKMYLDVISERDSLNAMLTNYSMHTKTMEVISKRLEALNAIIISQLSDRESDVRRANDQLQNIIADRESFIKSTRLILEENYPNFFTHLYDKGLEEYEIDFCCLYAIGMKGKEVKAYTSNRHYKDSSEVRQKLGLAESDTNLSIYLQKLLKNQQG